MCYLGGEEYKLGKWYKMGQELGQNQYVNWYTPRTNRVHEIRLSLVVNFIWLDKSAKSFVAKKQWVLCPNTGPISS